LPQVLNFADEGVMQAALRYIEYYPEVEYLVRDFEVFLPEAPGQEEEEEGLGGGPAGQPAEAPLKPPAGLDAPAASRGGDRRLRGAGLGAGAGARLLAQAAAPSAEAGSAANDPLLHYQWYLDKVGAPAAWQAYSSGAEIVVAVVDTGVDLSHPDLAGRLWTNTREIPNNGIDDDGNGYVDDVHGYDFNGACLNKRYDSTGVCAECAGSGSPQDALGHGSHVAGLIGAVRGNKEGMAGVAPRVKIMVLKVGRGGGGLGPRKSFRVLCWRAAGLACCTARPRHLS
jgi:subtilisin family serine protease